MPLSDFRFDGDYIHFNLRDGDGALVPCAVTADYLYTRAQASGMKDQNARAIFVLFRSEIESVAMMKFRAGTERPLLVKADLTLKQGELQGR
jgi:hypothetical protein